MQTLTLIHSDVFPIAQYADALGREAIAPRQISTLENLGADVNTLRVLLVDPSIGSNGHAPGSIDARTAVVGLGLTEQPKWLSDDSVYFDLPENPSSTVLLNTVRRAYQFLFQKQRADQLDRQLADRTRELREVSQVGIALSTERDHSVLLTKILSKARELSRADAGSLYLLDDDENDGRALRWKLAQNDSVDVDFEERVLPITKKSLAGYVALTGETLVIDDAYDLPHDAEYSINRSFDEENGYLTRSILVFPMTNHVGEVIGVLQLINRKRTAAKTTKLTAATVPDEVISFDKEIVEVMRSLAGQAAVAVENNLLYESIERLFEGFVTAAVTAIEQRDPTTSGHSFRVADLTVELARVIDRDSERYANVHFSSDQVREMRYASLLHDFGKVGVREQVLVKEKKLYPLQLETVRARFDFVMKAVENRANERKLAQLLAHGPDGYEAFAKEVDEETRAELERLQKDFAFIATSNEPTVLPEGDFQYLQQLAQREYDDIRGSRSLLLKPEEAKILSIRKGNLDAIERGEIESHVTHTYNFLQKIPWTKDLIGVPNIAYAHHEKLNGRGYPRKLMAQDIPLQSRMMTVSDIYDALTANDRPYKRAISTDRALDILKMEVADGFLDPTLVDLFVDAKVYERAGVLRT